METVKYEKSYYIIVEYISNNIENPIDESIDSSELINNNKKFVSMWQNERS